MSNLRDCIKNYQEELSEGIAWVAFWREGRYWCSIDFFFELDENVDKVMLPEQKKELEEILEKDPKAIILNGYSDRRLGTNEYGEKTNLAKLYHGVCWHYKNGTASKVKHFLEVTDVYDLQDETDKIEKPEETNQIEETDKNEKWELPQQFKRELTLAMRTEPKNKNKKWEVAKLFDSSVFGENIKNIIKKWDKALFCDDNETRNYCSTYWEAVQVALKHFIGIEYHFSRSDDYCGIVDEKGNWLIKIR